MELRNVGVIRGPNAWAPFPVLDVVVDLAGLRSRPLDAFPGFAERLRTRLPSLGGVEEPDPARALGLATLELQRLAGSPVALVAERPAGEPGVVRVAIEFEEEAIARAAPGAARSLCLAALDDRPFDLEGEVERLGAIASDERLGPSTRAIGSAARERGIPARRLGRDSLVVLGQGSRRRRIRAAEIVATGALAEAIARDKDLTKALLQAAGVPVPRGRPVEDAEDAWEAAREVGGPVVVKPLDGNHGRGVATDLLGREEVVAAYADARDGYRLLVVGERLVAAARRVPAHVIGDGRSTLAQLVRPSTATPAGAKGTPRP